MKDSATLPDGKTCQDCAHFRTHCVWLLSRQGDERTCDWDPSRFVPLTPELQERREAAAAEKRRQELHARAMTAAFARE